MMRCRKSSARSFTELDSLRRSFKAPRAHRPTWLRVIKEAEEGGCIQIIHRGLLWRADIGAADTTWWTPPTVRRPARRRVLQFWFPQELIATI